MNVDDLARLLSLREAAASRALSELTRLALDLDINYPEDECLPRVGANA